MLAAHKKGTKTKTIAQRFQLSQTKIRDIINAQLDHEYKTVTASALIAQTFGYIARECESWWFQ